MTQRLPHTAPLSFDDYFEVPVLICTTATMALGYPLTEHFKDFLPFIGSGMKSLTTTTVVQTKKENAQMSTVVQRTYRPQIAPGLPGLVADMTPSAVITRLVETAAGIPFGVAVSQGASDKGCIIGGSAFIGISVRDITLIPGVPIDPLADTGPAADTYPMTGNAAILTRGHIWVTAKGGGDIGVKSGDPLYFDATTGLLTNSASGASANGAVTFTQQPSDGQTITLAGTAVTFKASGATGLQSNIGPTLGDTIANLVAVLEASADVNLETLTFQAYPPSPGGAGEGSGANQLVYAAEAVGTAGNAIAVSTNVPGATVTPMGGGTAAATAVPDGYWFTSAISGELAKVSLGLQR